VTELKAIFAQFDSSVWTEEELDNAMDVMGDVLSNDIDVVALPDSIEFMTQDQLDDLIKTLIGVSDGEEYDVED